MAVEAPRGCGYRKVGGLYLCGSGMSMACDRLPYEIVNCPTCGSGLKFSRGFTWLRWDKYAGIHDGQPVEQLIQGKVVPGVIKCSCPGVCPICWPISQPYGLLWVGEKFYTPEEFIRESQQMGVSRRLPSGAGEVPRGPKGLKLGETWIVFAHKHVIPYKDEQGQDAFKPAVFYAFRPTAFEYLLWQSEATDERIADLEKAGITPIIIPDGDRDHDPTTPLGLDDNEKAEVVERVFFESLRGKLRGGRDEQGNVSVNS